MLTLSKSDSKKTALNMLNMFDLGVVHMIEGSNIDRPFNAITLTPYFHQLFGRFQIHFETVEDKPHTYIIDTLEPNEFLRRRLLPVTRTLYLTSNRTIDPPSSRLFKIHSAIARILHLSGAGEYIDKILTDAESLTIDGQGSSEIGRILTLKVGAWDPVTVY